MSSAREGSTGRLRLTTAAVGIALALAGCSAGQISQTAGMEPAVNGGIGQVGDIAVRDIQLVYPEDGVYERGGSAVVLGAVVNSGLKDDELVSVTSPLGQVSVSGDKRLPAGRMLQLESSGAAAATTTSSSSPSTTPSAPSGSSATSPSVPSGSVSPTSPTSPTSPSAPTATTTSSPTTTAARPTSIGKVTLVITGLTEDIRSGQTLELTFVFRNSGQATVTVPVAVPTTPRTPAAKEGEGH